MHSTRLSAHRSHYLTASKASPRIRVPPQIPATPVQITPEIKRPIDGSVELFWVLQLAAQKTGTVNANYEPF